jgi:hypothetical protein
LKAPKAPKAPKARKARKKSTRTKKPRLYKRYDPVDGHLEKVTRDDPRFDEWRTTRGTVASRKKKLLREDPVEYARTFGVTAVKRRAERSAETVVARTARAAARPAAAALAPFASRVAPFIGPVATLAAGAIALLLLQNRSVRNARLALGERINALSLEFVKQQQLMAQQYHVEHFGDVPAEARTRLLNGYKQALDQLTAATRVQQPTSKFGTVTYHTIGR